MPTRDAIRANHFGFLCCNTNNDYEQSIIGSPLFGVGSNDFMRVA